MYTHIHTHMHVSQHRFTFLQKRNSYLKGTYRNTAFNLRLYRQIWKFADSQVLASGGASRATVVTPVDRASRSPIVGRESAPRNSRESLFFYLNLRASARGESNVSIGNLEGVRAKGARNPQLREG